MQAGLKLKLFGYPSLSFDGDQPVNFRLRKSLALLTFLACNDRAFSRAYLAGLLWGETSERNARAGLRKSLAELHQVLTHYLDLTRHQVAFRRDQPHWVDVLAFDKHIVKGLPTCLGGVTSVNDLTLAARLYRADFLEGFHVRHAPEFEEWALVLREGLRQSLIDALSYLFDFYKRTGNQRQANTCAARLGALQGVETEPDAWSSSLVGHNRYQVSQTPRNWSSQRFPEHKTQSGATYAVKSCPFCGSETITRRGDGRFILECTAPICATTYLHKPGPLLGAAIHTPQGWLLVRYQGWPVEYFSLLNCQYSGVGTPESILAQTIREQLGMDPLIEGLYGCGFLGKDGQLFLVYVVKANGEAIPGNGILTVKYVDINNFHERLLKGWYGMGFPIKTAI